MALTAILTAGTSLFQAADSYFGGTGTPSDDIYQKLQPCPNQPSDAAVAVAWKLATPTEKQQLISYYMAGNNGAQPPPPIGTGPMPAPYAGASGYFAFAKALMGGEDCVNKGQPAAPQMLMQLVAKYANGATAPVMDAQTLEAAYAAGSREPTLGEYLARIGDNVKTTAENIVRATIGGAVQGATVSTQGAQTGAQAGTQLQMLYPFLLMGGGIALVMLLKKR